MSDWPQIELFNAMDWAAMVIVLFSGLLSLWRGFVREAISLASWIAAFVVANLLALQVTERLAGLIANPTGRYIVAWSLLFVGVLILGSLAAKLLSTLAKVSGLSVLDRILGTAFGFLRGALIVMALVFVLRQLIPESEQALLRDSQLMPHIDLLLGWTTGLYEDFRATELGSGISL